MDKKRFCLCIIAFFGSLILSKSVFPSEAYFNPLQIQGRIIQAIEECNESIDIAVTNISSYDILDALAKAEKRGVQIRIVIDRKRFLEKEPLSLFYRENGFEVRVFIQKGVMNNRFAIFDSKLLVTGSFHWQERFGRSNSDNAIFTDKSVLLVKYQREFDRLFYESVAPSLKEPADIAVKEVIKEKTEPIVTKEKRPGEKVVVSEHGITITEDPDGYIAMNFEEFNKIFGMGSGLADYQKISLWQKCMGKRVKWRGEVRYIGWGMVTGWLMTVRHGNTSVEVELGSDKKEHFSDVEYGDMVTYTGRLSSRVTKMFPYKLEEGDILRRQDTDPKPLSYDKMTEDPYIALAQGAGKEFVVESFEDMDNLFGEESVLSEKQKEERWGKYKGKYVSWIGKIVYKHSGNQNNVLIGFAQGDGEEGRMEIKVGNANKKKVSKFQEGDMVIYSGKLTERWGKSVPYVLEDGNILSIR